MPAVCRHRDICSGHHGYPPREIRTHSDDVFVNARGVARVGDRMQFHTISTLEAAHDAAIKPRDATDKSYNPSVFVNGKAVAYPKYEMEDARLMTGEEVVCNSKLVTASHNVYFEDNR